MRQKIGWNGSPVNVQVNPKSKCVNTVRDLCTRYMTRTKMVPRLCHWVVHSVESICLSVYILPYCVSGHYIGEVCLWQSLWSLIDKMKFFVCKFANSSNFKSHQQYCYVVWVCVHACVCVRTRIRVCLCVHTKLANW